ncbi:MAG TPA: Ohr family peroxiredoxin [Ktedonobacteraceae bacterium]
MKTLYTAEATVQGGRGGHAQSADGHLDIKLSVPSEMGGDGGQGTNPEQLFAAGYAACFQSALIQSARRQHVDADLSTIRAQVGIGPNGKGGFELAVTLNISIPGVEKETAEKLERRSSNGIKRASEAQLAQGNRV